MFLYNLDSAQLLGHIYLYIYILLWVAHKLPAGWFDIQFDASSLLTEGSTSTSYAQILL
jgi:hypothetical protein